MERCEGERLHRNLVGAAGLATALLIAPTAQHRLTFVLFATVWGALPLRRRRRVEAQRDA